MKKNIVLSLTVAALVSMSLTADAAFDYKAAAKAGLQAGVGTKQTTSTSTANAQLVNSYKSQINAIVARGNNLSKTFNSSVNGASALLLSKQQLAKARGNAAVNSAEAAAKLAEYMVGAQSQNVSNNIKKLSATQKSQLAKYVADMKTSMIGYPSVVKDATALTAKVSKTPSVALALSPELKKLKQINANAASQAKLATALISVWSK